jgi:aryl-alcohol dehydrogenase-like predicted oxidoreductase
MKLTPADLSFTSPPDEAWPEIALRFTLSQAGVHTAIIGTTNPDNSRRNIAYAQKGPLAPHVVQKIRDAFGRANADGSWTGQT